MRFAAMGGPAGLTSQHLATEMRWCRRPNKNRRPIAALASTLISASARSPPATTTATTVYSNCAGAARLGRTRRCAVRHHDVRAARANAIPALQAAREMGIVTVGRLAATGSLPAIDAQVSRSAGA